MKKTILGLLMLSSISFSSCGGSGKSSLSAKEFAQKIEDNKEEIVLDVRTPGEFSSGHLSGAVNIDWNASDFGAKAAQLDKSKPLFVYCLSGGRSASAAAALREMGFSTVYEMQGGLMQWRAAQLAEEGGNVNGAAGMSEQEYQTLLNSKALVLVDFYAEWCGPCKKMKPYLDELAGEYKDSLTLLRIDIEANPELTKSMGLEAVPVLKVYRNGKETWTHTGYVEKDEVAAQLK